ncbi:hypothetical protein AVEN_12522-1 [Araneus ventricosus]|uniref:Uncharacterized protein n=1 Tax=Araneus ventricosus TaxID=182803 RepID=A0A4Y2IM78_ARAVE|nr:hypothetical protein AVEN_12522-1 [Araneus ventricosus]
MSRFEATRGLFCNGNHNFQPRPDDENDTLPGNCSPNFHTTPAGGYLTLMYDLKWNRPNTRRIFSGIGFRTWNPPHPKRKPLGHSSRCVSKSPIYGSYCGLD